MGRDERRTAPTAREATDPLPRPLLVGRDEERRMLAAVLERARQGQPDALVVIGEPGIGKTALLDDLRAAAADTTIVDAAGAEGERAIPLAGLLTLLTPVRGAFAALDAPHGDVLAAITTTGEAAPVTAMGLAVLDLVSSMSEHAPVLVLLDDIHWFDELSLQVLGFARRRLHDHRVAVVAAARPGCLRTDQDVAELELAGLDGEGAHALLAATGESVTTAVADRCRDACRGNPMALLELGGALTPEQRAGVVPLPAQVPVGAHLHRWLLDRIADLPDRTRRALVVLALAGHAGPGVVAEALDRLGLRMSDLDAADRSGIVNRAAGVVELDHPLYGTTAVGATDPAHRRAAHRALAAALPDGALERRAWHLAEGCEDDPAGAVAALQQVAARATEQGAHLAAADAWERAGRLLPSPVERARALVAAGGAAWDAGRPDLATPLLRAARDLVPPGDVRASATAALGEVLGWSASIGEARRLLEAEVPHVERDHPQLAVTLLTSSARLASLAASPDAIALAAAAERVAAGGDDLAQATARTMATHVRLVAGEGVGLHDRIAELDALGALIENGVTRPLLELAQLLGFDLMVRERWAEARTTFTNARTAAREASLPGVEGFASAMAAEVAWRTGRWSEARAEASVDAAFHAPLAGLQGTFGDATLARVEAALALDESARQHAHLAIERGDQLGMLALSAWGRHALGLASLAAGHPQDALEPLTWIWRLERSGGANDPGVLWWHGDLLEALLGTGHRDDADRFVEQLEQRATATGRAWAAAIAARGRGLLRGDLGALQSSVELLDGLGAPFEAARSRLAHATLLDGEPRRAALDRAGTAFDALGAQPWIDRVRALGAGAPHPGPTAVAAVLTPAELRVALAVGRGLTNREAADALALSPRTVDAHLQSIFRKLRVHTRTQLALKVGAPAD